MMTFLFCSLGVAVNVALYAGAGGGWYNLAAAIFCGMIGLVALVEDWS